jgi:hypothetical protein
MIHRALSGRIRSMWVNQYNHSRHPTYRIVKEINASNLVPHILELYPNLPIIYLIRHPLAVAWSWTRFKWDEIGGFTAQNELMKTYFPDQKERLLKQSFVNNVYRWCLENTVPVRNSSHDSLLVVFYEELVSHPDQELQRIQLFLQRQSLGHWKEWKPDLTAIDRLSAMGTAAPVTAQWSGSARVDGWQREVPPELVSAGLEVVAEFGLDCLYGGASMPMIRPDELQAQSESTPSSTRSGPH